VGLGVGTCVWVNVALGVEVRVRGGARDGVALTAEDVVAGVGVVGVEDLQAASRHNIKSNAQTLFMISLTFQITENQCWIRNGGGRPHPGSAGCW
jgi:hypothetical protein